MHLSNFLIAIAPQLHNTFSPFKFVSVKSYAVHNPVIGHFTEELFYSFFKAADVFFVDAPEILTVKQLDFDFTLVEGNFHVWPGAVIAEVQEGLIGDIVLWG